MYTRILVPLDGSELAEQVLPYVRIVANGSETRIQLLRIFELESPNPRDSVHYSYPHGLAASIRAQAKDYLEGVAASLKREGLAVSSAVEEGAPAAGILSEAEKVPGTLIAMSTHGRSGIARWVLGSVTDKVLHATSNPLLITRSRESARAGLKPSTAATESFDTVIVPLDGSPLAEQALPHAVTLATALDLELLLVRVPFVPSVYLDGGGYPPPGYENLPEIEEKEVKEYLHKVGDNLRQQGVPWVQERMLRGSAAGAIVDLAQERPKSLVAMTTHGRSGVGRWILGSVTDRVVRHSGVPVLVVRSSGARPG